MPGARPSPRLTTPRRRLLASTLPASRAPQAILLAVPPDEDAALDNPTLVDILAETRALAHARMAWPTDLWAIRRSHPDHRACRAWALPASAWRNPRFSMDLRYERHHRIESRSPEADLERGFRSETSDPAWFLGKQWQMGEHQGEDASSPVGVDVLYRQVPIDPLLGDPRMDPRLVPPEAIVESEPGDWWTPGRRIQLGAAYAAAQGLPPLGSAGAEPTLCCRDLPYPYDRLNGRRLRWAKDSSTLTRLHPVFAEAPQAEPADLWNPAELAYETTFTVGGVQLRLERHDGGLIDWYSVDANQPLPPGEQHNLQSSPPGCSTRAPPTRVGGRSKTPASISAAIPLTAVILPLCCWSTCWLATATTGSPSPLPRRPLGTLVQLDQVTVKDSFDETYDVHRPPTGACSRCAAWPHTALLLWPTVTSPLSGLILDDVVLGIDEDANLLWGVEVRADGRPAHPGAGPACPAAGGAGHRRRLGPGHLPFPPGARSPPLLAPLHRQSGERAAALCAGAHGGPEHQPADLMPEPRVRPAARCQRIMLPTLPTRSSRCIRSNLPPFPVKDCACAVGGCLRDRPTAIRACGYSASGCRCWRHLYPGLHFDIFEETPVGP